MTRKQLEDLLRGVEAQLKDFKGVVNETMLKAFGTELEARIMKRIPESAPAADPTKKMTADRKQLNAQLRGMLNYKRAKEMPENERKALGLDVGSEGGFLVPEEFIAEVDRKLVKRAVIRPNARVFTGVGKKGSMPRETGTVSVTWEGELVATAETGNPSFGKHLWNLNKMKALTKLGQELIDNAAIDIVDLLAEMLAEQVAVTEDNVFMVGSGVNRPTGLRNLVGVTALAQVGANLVFDDLVGVKHTLAVQYRNNAAWLWHNDIIELVAKMVDGAGRKIFLDLSIMAGQGTNQTIPAQTVGFVLGHPVLEQNDIPTNLGAGAESEGWFGDLKRAYFIYDGGTMEMSSTTEGWGTFEEDAVGVKGLKFVDGKGANEDAIVYGSGWK